jgi:hypothetical protein
MKLIIDLDSTICDFMDPWLVWLNVRNYTDIFYRVEDIPSYDWIVDKFGNSTRDFFLDEPMITYKEWIKPYKGAKEFLDWCCENFDATILTHAFCEKTEEAKTWHVKHKIKSDIPVKFFRTLHDKFKHIDDGILIDDYPYHVIKTTGKTNKDSIIIDHDGRNGWSKLESYKELIEQEKVDVSKLHYTKSFEEIKEVLNSLR